MIDQVSHPYDSTAESRTVEKSALFAFRSLLAMLVFAPPLLAAVVGLLRPLASWINFPLGVVVAATWAAAALLWGAFEVIVAKKLRFGLTKLLVVTLVLGVAFGSWRAFVISPHLREQRARAAIREVTGNVWSEPFGPRWLRELFGDYYFQKVTQFEIVAQAGSDEELVYVTEFPKLRCLFLTGEEFTDAGLHYLRGLHQPVTVFLTRTSITNEGLDEIRGAAPNLELIKQ